MDGKRRAVVLLVTMATCGAQEWRLRDGPRVSRLAAHDAARDRLVVVGTDGDTYEWDGSRWWARPTRSGAFLDGRLAFDPVSRDLWLVGSEAAVSGTWLYDGARWRRVAAPGPAPRVRAALAFDSGRRRMVMFGGQDGQAATLDELWEWDGATWWQRAVSVRAPALVGAAMAYDPVRRRSVLFGGQSALGPNADQTWEWDGNLWQRRLPTVRPLAVSGAAMCWDGRSQRVVLHGGLTDLGFALDELWAFDGLAWSRVTQPLVRPAARWDHELTFDPVRGEIVLAGGIGEFLYLRDLWRFDGVQWRQIPALPVMPPRRTEPAVVAEAATGNVLSAGGFDPVGTTLDDTWRWNGSSWSLAATGGPSPRLSPAVWTDLAAAYLFGGTEVSGLPAPVQDTWRWNGSSWQLLATPVAPPARDQAAVAGDLATGVATLFGGRDAVGNVFGDTWVFDGTSWQSRNPRTSPPPRAGHAMAADFRRGRVLSFGGLDALGLPLDDTWEWDGADWRQVLTAIRPPARAGAAMAYDFRAFRMVLAVPGDLPGVPFQTWTFAGGQWAPAVTAGSLPTEGSVKVVVTLGRDAIEVFDGRSTQQWLPTQPQVLAFGAACGSPPMLLQAETWPRLTAVDFALAVTRAPANAPTALLVTTTPGTATVGGCPILVGVPAVTTLTVVDGNGNGSWPLPLALTPAWLGTVLSWQAAALQPAAAAGFVTSAGLRTTIGG